MAITLLASACPAVQGPSGLKKLSDAYSAEPSLLEAYTLAAGSPSSIPSKWNANAQFIELLARYGPCGVFGVAYGLTISVVSGLTIQVAAGHGLMESLVELATNTNATAFDNADSYVWFKQDGTIEVKNGTTTAPAIDAVYIGRVTATGGTVSATIEYAGVVYLKGMSAIRETADLNYPSDTPISSLTFLTKTSGGTFFWDGTAWLRFQGPMATQRDTLPAGQTMVIPAGEQVLLFDTFTNLGTISVLGKLRVIE